MPQIARLGDAVTCPKGQTTITGGSKHEAGGQRIARVGDSTGCGCSISSGSGTVKIGGQDVAMVGGAVDCGGVITGGLSKVSV